MLKVAVIGVGNIGRHHARIYRQSNFAKLVGVSDTSPEIGQRIANLYNVPWYEDYRTLLEEQKPDAVSIAVPTFAHFQVMKDAIEAGCHILVEKPISATIEEGRAMVKMAAEAGKVLRVGHVERFNPAISALKEKLTENSMGRIFQIHTRRLGPFPAHVKDVGVIMDLAVHDLDIMRYLTDSEVNYLFAETKRELHEKHEDVFSGNVRFQDNTLGILEINWLTPTKVREISITGEAGMFVANYLTQDLYFYENGEIQATDWTPISILRGVSEGLMTRYPVRRFEPLYAELEGFIKDIHDGGQRGASGEDGLKVVELAIALIKSGQQMQVIRMA